jgi:hypothetical protein
MTENTNYERMKKIIAQLLAKAKNQLYTNQTNGKMASTKTSATAKELAGTIGLHRQAGHVQTLKLK